MTIKRDQYGALLNDKGERVCDLCQREDHLARIHDAKIGRRVMWCFDCHPDPDAPVAQVAKKIAEHEAAGTLADYPLTQRLAELRGEVYRKPS